MKNPQFLAHKVFVFTLVSILMVTFGSLNISFAQEDTPRISDDTVLTGPWLWMVAPTGAEGEDNEISPEIDSLAAASDGAVTETHIAENGANEGDIVGDWGWIYGLLTPSDTDKRKYCGVGFFIINCENVYWQNNLNDTLKRLGFSTGDDMVGNTAYALIYLVSPQNQSGTMYMESGDAVKVWLNGKVVHRQAATHLPPRSIKIAHVLDPGTSVPDPRTWESGTVSFPVTLKAGTNLLLVKVRQNGNYWDMRVQLDADFATTPSRDGTLGELSEPV